MGRKRVLARLGKVLVVAGMSAILVSSSWAEGKAAQGKAKEAKEKTLHNFTFKSDGAFPFAGLSFDAKGNLYGASYYAGAPDEGICCGAVFQLAPDKNSWKFNVIYSFTGGVTDGEAPSGSVVFDSFGNLYGTTQQGDSVTGCGGVYELSPTAKGEWKETILYAFNPVPVLGGVAGDGCTPSSDLIFDRAGNLYGTTQQGGGITTGGVNCDNWGCGSVFKLSPQPNGKWTESVIHSFGGTGDGVNPYGGLALDSAGNLWGTTTFGGSGTGIAFELTPGEGGVWNESIAFNFANSTTGYVPYSGLVVDSANNLYGATFYGGAAGFGVVFELTPQAGGQASETVLHEFQACNQTECPDGIEPFGGLVFDGSGNLYGSTQFGGGGGNVCDTPPPVVHEGCGTVYELTPAPQNTWDYSIVYRFTGAADGGYPSDDHLAVDSKGTIFGTTFVGGNPGDELCPQEVLGLGGCGVVFKIKP